MEVQKKSWCNFPIEIFNLIYERLYYVDQIRFRAVCKSWRSNIHSVKFAGKIPWIMAYNCEKLNDFGDTISTSFLYDPSLKRKYTIMANERDLFIGAEVCASKHGWLLFSKREKPAHTTSFFFYSPFTDEVMKLPEFPAKVDVIDAVTFSTSPTSPDCVIFVMSDYPKKFQINSCKLRDGEWISLGIRIHFFYGNFEDVVYLDGVFYCSFSDGVLGAFRALKEWKIYEYPTVPDFRASTCLIESNGKLLRTYYDYECKPYWRVFEFNWSEMNWFEVKSIGKRSLFIGLTSISVAAEEEASELANTIHYLADWLCSSFSHKVVEYHSSPPIYNWIENDWLSKFWIQPPQQDHSNIICKLY